jgi:hypothetical protein
MRAKIFRIFLALQYGAFFGLIGFGIYDSDTFNPKLLLPLTVIGVAAGINTMALFEDRAPK